jgi:CarD family transcriptional regulator
MSNFNFTEGQFVVYPAHGVGVIKGIETQNIAGMNMKMVVITFEKDKLVVRLPIGSTAIKKIRKLSSKEDIDEAINHLRTPTKTRRIMWSRRVQEYEAKINSGDIMSITQVVRELHRTENQTERSYSERQIYLEAIDRLSIEYAVVAKIDKKQALENLQKALAA